MEIERVHAAEHQSLDPLNGWAFCERWPCRLVNEAVTAEAQRKEWRFGWKWYNLPRNEQWGDIMVATTDKMNPELGKMIADMIASKIGETIWRSIRRDVYRAVHAERPSLATRAKRALTRLRFWDR